MKIYIKFHFDTSFEIKSTKLSNFKPRIFSTLLFLNCSNKKIFHQNLIICLKKAKLFLNSPNNIQSIYSQQPKQEPQTTPHWNQWLFHCVSRHQQQPVDCGYEFLWFIFQHIRICLTYFSSFVSCVNYNSTIHTLKFIHFSYFYTYFFCTALPFYN